MEFEKSGKEKKNLIIKAWEKCKSIRGGRREKSSFSKSKSWSCSDMNSSSKQGLRKSKSRVAPEGCFSVYVGPERQRFVVKAKYANHPLFKMLLEDAELEYGYNSDGPISLPCDVDLFYKVLAEMESEKVGSPKRGFAYGSCSPFNPTRRLGNSNMAKGYGSYGLLTPSRLLKMN